MLRTLPGSMILLAAFVVTACSGSAEPAPLRDKPAPRTFSAEEQRIARKLSIGNNTIEAVSPENRAVLCALGLESIAGQLQASGALSPKQLRVFAQARNTYRRRAEQGYPSDAALAEARRKAATDFPERSDRARIAISCLRELA